MTSPFLESSLSVLPPITLPSPPGGEDKRSPEKKKRGRRVGTKSKNQQINIEYNGKETIHI